MALIGVAIVALAGFSSAETPDDYEDKGTFYSMTCRFIYAPSDCNDTADTVEWDFGDGSTAAGKIVDHTYSETGVYYVKQTATNTIGTSVAWYKVEILGYPVISYYVNGTLVKTVQQDAYGVAAKNSGIDGVSAWYTDRGMTSAYDMSSYVTRSLSLYGSSSNTPAPAESQVTVTFMDSEGNVVKTVSVDQGSRLSVSDLKDMVGKDKGMILGFYTDSEFTTVFNVAKSIDSDVTVYVKYGSDAGTDDYIVIGLAVAGIVALIVAAVTRHPIVILAAVALFAAAGIHYFGVI
ncbi:PKD domain protein [Thermoplasmatales archaeon BRNA1]|nr:PKD domain protein [Thermoplasmatales archaeon BRNA1]